MSILSSANYTLRNILPSATVVAGGKVMFSQACVKICPRGGISQHAIGQTPPPPTKFLTHGGQTPPLGRHPLGRHPRTDTSPPPPEMATAADGTDPTGMHSCLLDILPLLQSRFFCLIFWEFFALRMFLIIFSSWRQKSHKTWKTWRQARGGGWCWAISDIHTTYG